MSHFRWLKTPVPPCGRCPNPQYPPSPYSATFLHMTPDIWFGEEGFTPGAISQWREPTSWAPTGAYRDTVPVTTETLMTLRSNLVNQYLLGKEEWDRRTWERKVGGSEERECSLTNNKRDEREGVCAYLQYEQRQVENNSGGMWRQCIPEDNETHVGSSSLVTES